jgi:parallel beta-helix repeat protein
MKIGRNIYVLLAVFIYAEALGAQSASPRIRRTKKSDPNQVIVAKDGRGKFTSIQDAIDNAEYNATVRIRAGVYKENIILRNFVSLEGDGIGRTVIVSDSNMPVVQAYNLNACSISDISFEFTAPTEQPVFAARYSNFSIENCTFKYGSDGIAVETNCSVIIKKSLFAYQSRNGLLVRDKSHGTISDCLFAENGEDGIAVTDHSTTNFVANTIRKNGGNGIRVDDNSINKILGNYIYENKRNGILVTRNSSPLIRNNTIVRNGADRGGDGFAILIFRGTAVSLINNNCVKNRFGIGIRESKDVSLSHNNLWQNDSNYVTATAHPTDMSVDPIFVNESKYDFHIDTTSQLFRRGEDEVSIGAHYDNARTEEKRRLDYLKSVATKELGHENWYLAYQSAQEILSIDKNDTEGKIIFKKACAEMASGYITKARTEYDNENTRTAGNFLNLALSYDPDNKDALELKAIIEERTFWDRVVFILKLAGVVGSIFFLGYWWKKRIQLGEVRRQAQWWLDDAEEQIELARTAECEKLAPDDYAAAIQKFGEARSAFGQKAFDACEALCNESSRLAARGRDAADKYKQTRKDALWEVSNAEAEMRRVYDSELIHHYAGPIKEFSFYLERAQEALVHKQFVLAKEIADDIQASLKKLYGQLQANKENEVHRLIEETEKRIIQALASNHSADIIVAVIDFKSELEILKSGFQNGQLTIEEIKPQVHQIKEFIEEALRVGSEEVPLSEGRKKNYYEILGVKEDATLDQIKSVFRKLSMIYHPDMNPDDAMGIAGDERFKEIKEAYEMLIREKSKQEQEP